MKRGLLRGRPLVWAGLALAVSTGAGLIAQGQQQPPPQQQAPQLPPPINESKDPLLKPFVWRAIGPANMGGRIDDIAVDESNPSTFYIGLAGGGLWKTTNNGTTWTPIFDTYFYSSIGDIALAPSNPNIIYVGTGEPNNRQSSTLGGGMYKSTDGGKKFEHVGLKESQTIARVVVHPKDPNTVYVAALGHLFGPNKERGLYKTTDGGKTWTNTKFIDEDTGFTEVVMDPSNPNVLFAASYQRRRQPWGFNGGGQNSAIWKTTDGAKTWTKVTGNGLPDNPIIGRIGLDIARSKPNTIYASIEVGASGGTGAGVNEDGSLVQPGQGRGGGGGRGQAPPPPDPKKSGIWRSDDGGRNWRFLSNDGDRWMYYSQIRVDPTNPEIAYQGGAPFFKSVDGGKTWRRVGGVGHSDHHAIWINPRNNQHILLGNDGGLDISYDQGDTWEALALMPLGQFYAVSADMRKPYYVCGGLQDNGSWCGPSRVRSGVGILNTDWFRVGGGDGFYTAQDPTDWTVIYSESQDGNTNRLDLRTGSTQSIRPRGPGGRGGGAGGRGQVPEGVQLTPEQQAALAAAQRGNIVPAPAAGTNFRFFWSTPFMLSPHNPRTVYLGGERLFRSFDRGNTWMASTDLTRNIGRNDRPIMGVDGKAPMASKHDGAASYSNIVTISESPVVPGIIWAGTNDGNVQISRDGGDTFKNVIEKIPGAPKEAHVSRVEASHFDAGTAYVTIDNHRLDDHKPYVYKTTDYGETWTSISGNLPDGNVNVIREDPKNRQLLYLGTEYALYVSLNGGKDWKEFMTGMPYVRIDDILVHPRDNDLIVGTHGRSIWILDDISPLQQMTDQVMTAESHVFDVRPAVAFINDIQKTVSVEGAKHFRGENPDRGSAIHYFLKSPAAGDVRITVSDITGREIRTLEGPKTAGLHRVQWNLAPGQPGGRRGGAPVPPGTPAQQQSGQQAAQQAAQQTAQQAAGRGGAPAPQVQQEQQQQPPQQQAGRGGGRGGGGQAVPAGTYLVKVMVGDKEIGRKTITVEPDLEFMR